jgi:NADH pyrophosphatase NudC (nudix superfamily)
MNQSKILNRALELVEEDSNTGICIKCGNKQCAEPDARNYECEECGANQVFGAEEIILMFA